MPMPWDRISVLAGLSPGALAFLTQKAQEISVRGGEAIVKEGESGNRMFLIRSGEVRVLKSNESNEEVEIARLKAPDFFGEMCILDTLPREATVEAVGDAVVSSLSSGDFYELYRAMPEQYSILVLNIARDLSRRLRKLDRVFAATH